MTVGELKEILKDAPDHLQVIKADWYDDPMECTGVKIRKLLGRPEEYVVLSFPWDEPEPD